MYGGRGEGGLMLFSSVCRVESNIHTRVTEIFFSSVGFRSVTTTCALKNGGHWNIRDMKGKSVEQLD